MDFNSITKHTEQYVLKKAIMVYECPGRNRGYVQEHDVKVVDGRPVLLSGRAISEQTGKELGAACNAKIDRFGIIPKRLLACKPNGDFLWFCPAQERFLNVSKALGFDGGHAHFPGLIFGLIGRRIHVYATTNNRNLPRMRSRVYLAPFWNVYGDGSVCMGTAKYRTQGTLQERLVSAEKAFFGSQFSHMNESGCVSGSLTKLWKRLIESHEAFPRNELRLLSPKRSLGELVAHLGF